MHKFRHATVHKSKQKSGHIWHNNLYWLRDWLCFPFVSQQQDLCYKEFTSLSINKFIPTICFSWHCQIFVVQCNKSWSEIARYSRLNAEKSKVTLSHIAAQMQQELKWHFHTFAAKMQQELKWHCHMCCSNVTETEVTLSHIPLSNAARTEVALSHTGRSNAV